MLPPTFLTRPLAHRGLHGPGLPENSLPAFRAAIAAGYGIELDVQPARDDTPLVFHDAGLRRMAGIDAPVSSLGVAEAAACRLLGTTHGIPTLDEVLALVAGRVPVLIEVKDPDGALGPDIGTLPGRVADIAAAQAAQGHPVAVMSFNPHVVAAMARPGLAAGLTSCGFAAADWPLLDAPRRAALARLEGFEAAGACFISHDCTDLDNPAVLGLARRGVPVLCWTIRSAEAEAAARRIARNITFEGYRPCAS